MKNTLLLITVGIMCLTSAIHAQNNAVVINELMSSNSEAVADEAGDFDDWIELYNNTDAAIDLSGYGLSDDVESLGKFLLPAGTTISENGYLIIWADDDQEQGDLHAQFKLSSSGEDLYLTDPNNNIIDQISFGEIPTDNSFARDPNGTGDFVIKGHTHNDNNDLVSSTLSAIPASIQIFPNPTVDILTIQLDNPSEIEAIRLFDALGREVYSNFAPTMNTIIDSKELANGNYYLSIGDFQAVVIQKMN